MKFAMSYSCGKDSTLALHKMRAMGHEPVCLVVMVNESVERSYFHGADLAMLRAYEKALRIPMILCNATADTYQPAFEAGLAKARALGAEAACFGDIDILSNRQWEEDRCLATGLRPFFPLWQNSRKENVWELLSLGYQCQIKSINTALLPKSLLGRFIDSETISIMEAAGVDICGENGEYHTLVVDGPVFQTPLSLCAGEILDFGGYAAIDLKLKEAAL